MKLPRHLLAAFFTTIILVGCDTNESSQLKEATYEPASQPNPTEKAEVIGDALGIPEAKPATDSEGQELLGVRSPPLLYSDAGLMVALQGEVTVADGAQISKALWRQVSGPEAQILNAIQQQAQVIIPQVTKITDLEFAFAAADTSNRVAEARTRIRVSPVEFSGVIAQSASTVSAGLITITLSLPESPDAAVTLQYRTQDGSALAGRDYESTQGQVTLTQENPHATIEITALNSDVVSGGLYFIVNYSVEPNGSGTNLYVALPTERGEPEPQEPIEPVEPMPTTYSVIYKAGEGGRIQGNAEQILTAGENSSSVTAIAEPGYRFIGWSDGLAAATRMETEINANLQLAAEFRRNELWLATGHRGNLNVNAGPTTATIDWPVEEGKVYNLIVTADPETEIQNYSAYEADLLANVTPPLDIAELTTDQPVYIALQEDGVLKAWSSFVPRVLGTDGRVKSIALGKDGSRYIGGKFTLVAPMTGASAAIPLQESSPTPHALAGVRVEGSVHCSIPDGQGGWYLGGRFEKVGGAMRRNLAHIDSTGAVTEWNPDVDGEVSALVFNQGVIYVGGQFTQSGNETRASLAAFDTRGLLLPWNPQANGRILTLAMHDGLIYAGGTFTEMGGLKRSRIAALNALGETSAWNPSANNTVRTLVIDDGIIYTGGDFTTINNIGRSRLAALAPEGQLLPWYPSIARGPVNAIAINDGVIYVGGGFNEAGGEQHSKLAAFDTQGQLLNWNPEIDGVNSYVRALIINNNSIYVGGDFERANGEKRTHLAAFDKQGQLLPWTPIVDGPVFTMSIDQGLGYIGGAFTQTGGQTRMGAAALNAVGQLLPWNPQLRNNVNDEVHVLKIHQNVIYVGGSFFRVNDEERHNLAAFNIHGQLLPWNPRIRSGNVFSLAFADDLIYVGGAFSQAGGEERIGLAAFDTGGQLTPWNPKIDGHAYSLSIEEGTIYAGGEFNHAADQPRSHLAAFDTQGQLLPWNPYTNGHVNSLIVNRGTIYIGGGFTQAGGEIRSQLAAFDNKGQLLAWNPKIEHTPGIVRFIKTLAIKQDVIYAGGSFTQANGEVRLNLAAFDLSGQLLPWNPQQGLEINALTINQDMIYIGGWYSQANSEAVPSFSIFDTDGNSLNK